MDNYTEKMDKYLKMSYAEYVAYLLEKYGPAKYDYFYNENCKSKNNKNSRSAEGLFCHHVDEDKEILLSTPEIAQVNSFEYQKADRLVYADYLEHLLLHVKIVEEDEKKNGCGLGGVIMISSVLNDYFRHGRADGWKRNAMKHVDGKYEKYIEIMRRFKEFVDSDDTLRNVFAAPELARGWYRHVNWKVHKDLYGH